MTAPSALTALLDVQALDTQLHGIMTSAQALRTSERTHSLLARRTQAIEAAKKLDAVTREAADAVTQADEKVRGIQARIDRDTQRLNRGGTPKELMGTQHEIDTLTQQRAAAEQRQYEAMERAEAVAADKARKVPLLRAADAEAREAVAQRDAELASLKQRHEEFSAQRPELVAAVGDEALVKRYDALRTARGGGRTAVARFQDHACGGCGTHYSPGETATVQAAAADVVPTCFECSALLVR